MENKNNKDLEEKVSNSEVQENSDVKSNDVKQITNKVVKKKKQSKWAWPVKILVITLFLSLAISVASEFILGNAGIVSKSPHHSEPQCPHLERGRINSSCLRVVIWGLKNVEFAKNLAWHQACGRCPS